MIHIFYFPASYTAVIYAILSGAGLLSALFIGVISHKKEILTTACGEEHWEFWPSISSAIGDMYPERQVWRAAFVLCTPFRIGCSISLFNVFWQNAGRGMTDLYAFRSSWKQFFGSSAFLTMAMLWVDLWRLIAAVVWSLCCSSESLAYHNLGFCPYVLFCFLLQLILTKLVERNRNNLAIYSSPRDAVASYSMKRVCLYGEAVASLGVVFGYLYHFNTCANGSFSISNCFEWTFATMNILYDASAWFDLKKEGWWLSGSPRFYRQRWGQGAAHLRGGGAREGDMNGGTGAGLPSTAGSAMTPPGATTIVPLLVEDEASGDPSSGVRSDESSTKPPGVTGEPFLDADILLHRFTFCCAPSRLVMWLADIYWAHLFFEQTVHLVQHMYFMPLIAMSLSWEIGSVLFLGAPVLLRIRSFRRWATGPCVFAKSWLKPSHMPAGLSYRTVPMYVLFYAIASLSHLHLLILGNAGHKILGVSVGPLFLSLALTARFLYPSTATLRKSRAEHNEDSRRLLFSFPLGLVLCMLLRVLHLSVSPFFTDPFYGSILGIFLGLNFTAMIYRHAMFGNTLKEGSEAVLSSVGLAGEEDPIIPPAAGAVYTHDGEEMEKKGDAASPKMPHVRVSLSQMDEVNENTIAALATAYQAPPAFLLGLFFGLVCSFSLTFYTCANYIPRLLAIDPFPTSLLIAGVFVLGLIHSPDALPVLPQLLKTKTKLPIVRRVVHLIFQGSFVRFGVVFVCSTALMLFATRQTNFTYETPHDGYPVSFDTPREKVSVKDWKAQEEFWGSKHLALLGGLAMTFCFGVLYPVAMELCWSHQRDRRFARLADVLEAEAVLSRENTLVLSFELWWLTTTITMSVLYALCISYPFVPMGWLVREKSKELILAHVFGMWMCAAYILRRIRTSKKSQAAISDVATARKQRSIQLMVLFIIAFAFVWIYIGRVSMAWADVSFPEGKTTALKYQDEVLHLHRLMVKLRTERNIVTDDKLKKFEKEYHREIFEEAMRVMEKNITEAKARTDIVDPKYGVSHLSPDVRRDVYDAAKAMTFFSGAIWTVHFGLDNYNVDSFNRMVQQLRSTEAGVIGLLESDSMHLTNGNRDMVEYISYYLGFRYTDYGPTSLDNTYGCAMISRYPIKKVHRYVIPSPLGELSCVIHATLDVYGLPMETYVGHFGNTEHWADGLLQSQFLGRLVTSNPGPSMWLGYLVTHPGMQERYHEYTDPAAPGKFRDAGLEMYLRHPWARLAERGGFEEEPPVTVTATPGESVDFNVEYKIPIARHLEEGITPDVRFRRPPADKPPRYFYYKDTNRYTKAHPRWEFLDRYCQYSMYKTGATSDERPQDSGKLQPYQVALHDWWRIVDGGVEELSDTEIQVIQLRFEKRIA